MPPSLPPPTQPRHLDAAAPGRLTSPAPPNGILETAPAPRPTGVFHLLLVEKDPAMRAMLTGMLAGPYEVEAVGDNLEAGQAVERRPPDLVIVDLYLREPDGLTLVRALRASPATAEVPVILLTASTDPAPRTEARTSNVKLTLYKPFGMKELLANVHSALAQSAQAPNARP